MLGQRVLKISAEGLLACASLSLQTSVGGAGGRRGSVRRLS